MHGCRACCQDLTVHVLTLHTRWRWVAEEAAAAGCAAGGADTLQTEVMLITEI